MTRAVFRTLFNKDFGLADIACAADTWVKIGTFTNEEPATKIQLGHKNGYIQIKLYDDTVDSVLEAGLVRVIAVSPHGYRSRVIYEERSENLEGDAYDKTKKIKLDPIPVAIGYQGKFELWFLSDSADTLDETYCSVLIDCTVHY